MASRLPQWGVTDMYLRDFQSYQEYSHLGKQSRAVTRPHPPALPKDPPSCCWWRSQLSPELCNAANLPLLPCVLLPPWVIYTLAFFSGLLVLECFIRQTFKND